MELFARRVHEKINSFERDIADAVSELTLKEVLDEIRFSADRYFYSHMDFERGQPIESGLMCNTFRFRICLDKASLVGPYDLRVKSFDGLEVSKTYDEWCAGIQKAEEEYKPPF